MLMSKFQMLAKGIFKFGALNLLAFRQNAALVTLDTIVSFIINPHSHTSICLVFKLNKIQPYTVVYRDVFCFLSPVL